MLTSIHRPKPGILLGNRYAIHIAYVPWHPVPLGVPFPLSRTYLTPNSGIVGNTDPTPHTDHCQSRIAHHGRPSQGSDAALESVFRYRMRQRRRWRHLDPSAHARGYPSAETLELDF